MYVYPVKLSSVIAIAIATLTLTLILTLALALTLTQTLTLALTLACLQVVYHFTSSWICVKKHNV